MKFSSSYEPNLYEADIYAAWEAAGVFKPKIPTVPIDNDSDGVDDRFEVSESGISKHYAGANARSERQVLSRDFGARQREMERARPVATGASDAARGSTCPRPSYYSIVMPPPNANGNLHIGHGLTVALEDSLTRFHRLKGDSTWYIPGADHAGFETWVVYERTLEKDGHTRFEYSRDELYARVWDFVEMQRGNMELQLRALGASCSWDDLTFTLDENVIDRVYTTFEKMWNDGLIYRGEKLVNFCPKHQTAFADIEVEHEDEKGTLWEIEYRVVEKTSEDGISKHCAGSDSQNYNTHGSESETGNFGEESPERCDFDDREPSTLRNTASEVSLIVSTTRPETLFGDTAVAVNPEDERYKDLIGKTVHLPLTDREIPIIADEHADPEYGTGAVKITPAHDFDDFEVGERHDLPRIQVISEDGRMINVPEKYEGMTTEECRKQVLKDLKEQGYLKGEQKIIHSVAHCYKCGTVLEPMLKEQWFIDVEKLAKVAIEHLEKGEIKFHPENKQRVLINYLKNLKDWNISRQIPWGIAIPMFRKVTTEATDEPDWIFDRRTNLKTIEKSGVVYERDEDTFDTWFSSSHWPIVCTDWSEENPTPYYPLNVMETGADILFAWVARMIMMGLYVTGEVPFKEVYLHGLVLDEHGQKMSKSKGNVINPIELVAKYGSDAFRLGILRGRSAGMNQAFSENSVVASRNLCNKLWNISRLVQSIVDEDEDEGAEGDLRDVAAAPYSNDNMGEDWICREINACLEAVASDMKNYRFSEAVETLYQTIWDKYADWFLESQKIFRNVPLLKITLEHLLIALHPFAPFVTEAIWQNLSWTEGFIITQKWPEALKFDPITAEQFETIRTIVSEVRTTLQSLPGTNNAKKYPLLFDNDSLVDDNALLIKNFTKVPDIKFLNGSPRGLRIALANHELYLDVPASTVEAYKGALTAKILAVGGELNALNLRMMNPNYVEKAPEHLVKETRNQIKEKEALIARLKAQLELI
ncbi:MAG: valine--tRNA ligase [Candidatus Saccharibacteria bacterium]|nr:valine--tRNA ligase [Candidatus Saccharibacteria bacterium]